MNNEMKSIQLKYFENFPLGRCKMQFICVVLLTEGAEPTRKYCSFYPDDLILEFQTLKSGKQGKG